MSIRDVARRAKVSIATVSRALNNSSSVDPVTAARVRKAAEELRYFPDSQARSLVSGRSRILGLIVSDITNPFFPELVKGFEDVAISYEYEIMVSSTNYDSARMALCVRRLLERKVEGVAIMTSEMDQPLIDQLVRRKVPTVFLDVGSVHTFISNIQVDYTSGINAAVKHLLELGHRRIGFISGPLGLKSACIRRTAFLERLAGTGILEEDELVREGDHTIEGGLEAMTHLLALAVPPTAVLASNDLTAIGAMRAIRRKGWSVPDDVSVIGFDDIHFAEFTEPPLTTVALSRWELAENAIRALVSQIDARESGREANGAEFYVKPSLVIRQSTGSPKRKA
ncbi:MAG TPA: LacI family DNA-binding transcriptional regulator [Bryobacteraceae bacterium]|nr:LacI family DNA-binding transcriptional regulator [Bryobacteraceae bacterium]